MIMSGLFRGKYGGKLYPVNPRGGEVMGVPAYPSLLETPGDIDLAIVAVPAEHIWGVLKECADRGVKGILMITAGFAEAVENGREMEEEMARFAREKGMRIVGPNVSGIFDQSSGFYACPAMHLPVRPSPVTFICQGGFAIYDIMRKGHTEHRGIGKLIHTGNEADLKLTDFLEYAGDDEQTEVILLHIEGIRDGRRFFEVGKKVAARKPVIAFKAGVTREGSRAAASHTGALAGSGQVYSSLFRQTGMIEAPHFEMILEMGYAFLQLPPVKGERICVVTMGGSWGVMITDALVRHGLKVPEPSKRLQKALRALGFPVRASTRNPIDVGAAGASLAGGTMVKLLRELITSGEFDAVLLHGLCMAGFLTEKSPPGHELLIKFNKDMVKASLKMGAESGVPVLPLSYIAGQESQIYKELSEEGITIYNRTDDVAAILAALRRHHRRRV
jgi:acyl-CoA synthetase (NDP forming)